MSNDFEDPKAWLENIDKGTANTPNTHPDDPNFGERVPHVFTRRPGGIRAMAMPPCASLPRQQRPGLLRKSE